MTDLSTVAAWPSRQAVKNYTNGKPHSTWASNDLDDSGVYQLAHPGHGGARVFKSDFAPHFEPKFMLGPNPRIFAAGSCFAREIELALAKRKIDVMSWTPASGLSPSLMNRHSRDHRRFQDGA